MQTDPQNATRWAPREFQPRGKEDIESSRYGRHVLRFVFSRNPYERLVSAYVQKFELGYKSDFVFYSKSHTLPRSTISM